MTPRFKPFPARQRSLDWLRGLAVVVMIECHVFNALLAASYRDATWFRWLDYLNGFVAPAFLLVSGAVMGINLQSRWEHGTVKLWRRVGQILLVAYLLHLPTLYLWEFFGPGGTSLLAALTRMDILQCVAGSLAMVLLLAPVCRQPLLHRRVCLALGVGLALLTVDGSNVALPKWLLCYFWPTGIGLFPLVPWAGFTLIGVWLGPAILAQPHPREQALRAAMAGLFMIFTASVLPAGPMYGAGFVFGRLGWLLAALAVCVWLDAPARGTRWCLRFGELSLWSYTVHLVIVYGSCLNPGLDALKARFSPLVVVPTLGGVLFTTALVINWRAGLLARQSVKSPHGSDPAPRPDRQRQEPVGELAAK